MGPDAIPPCFQRALFGCFAAESLGRSRKKREVLGQHLLGGDDLRGCVLGGESERPLMSAVGEIGQGNSVERSRSYREKRGHGSLLGQP